MRRTLLATSILVPLLAPVAASAHQHEVYRIGGKMYEITIGSLNEPVAVDDKTGVDLAVAEITEPAAPHADAPGTPADHDHEDEVKTPVNGLEQTLKVELQAGDARKELPLTTVYGKPGSYKAVFIPTVQTTYTYRVFGTIAGAPVDLSFQCNPAGHPATPEDTTEMKISDGVSRMSKAGAFGCPAAKADLGFPEPAPTLVELGEGGDGGNGLAIVAIALAAASLAIGFGMQAKNRKTL